MQVRALPESEVVVPIIYFSHYPCCINPYNELRKLSPSITPIVDPNQLEQLLTPPLGFSSRRMLYWSPLPFVLLILLIVGLPTYITLVVP